MRAPILLSLIALLVTARADAAPVTSALFVDGQTINNLNDDNADFLIDVGDGMGGAADGLVSEGDYLLAILKVSQVTTNFGGMQSIDAAADGYNELTGISLIKVASKTADGTFGTTGVARYNFEFTAPTIDEWAFYTSALTGGATVIAPTDPGVLFIAYDGGVGGGGAPLHDFTRESTIAAGIASATNGAMMWQAGFTGTVTDVGSDGDTGNDTVSAGAFEGWMASAPEDFSGFVFPAVKNSSFVSFGLNQVGASGPGAAGITLLPTTSFGGLTEFGGPTQFQGNGGFEPSSSVSGWPLFSRTDIYILPTPEPGSLILFGIGSLALASCGYRRRQSSLELTS